MNNEETILEEAARLTSTDRQSQYGHPLDNHTGTAEHWTTHLRQRGLLKPGAQLNFRDVCWMMVFQKGSRDAHCEKRDNLVDGAGYLRNIEMSYVEDFRRLQADHAAHEAANSATPTFKVDDGFMDLSYEEVEACREALRFMVNKAKGSKAAKAKKFLEQIEAAL